jgi:uncharacterized phage protein (predicted DNA packaging)
MRQIRVNSLIGTELITIDDVKLYAKIDTSVDDSLITNMISQARIWCENYISRDIISKNRTYYMDETNGMFDLPFAPVASVSSVTSEDVAAPYSIIGLDNETIELTNGSAFQVKVTYITSGINDAMIKQAMLQFVSMLYDNRSDFVEKSINEIPTNVKSLLNTYKSMFI